MRIFLLCLTLTLLCGMTHAANAAPFTGSISIETPVRTPDFKADDSAALLFDLRLPDLIGPITVWGNLEHRLKDECFRDFDSKFRIGGDIPLLDNLTLYSYFERRYAYNLNRIVVGARLNFRGSY